MNNEKCIDICNGLLRGEISALETYDQALEKFANEPEAADLRLIKSDHQESVNRLRENIKSMGGTPSKDSGAWGTFAKAVQGSATLFGQNAALTALKKGEEQGRSSYEDALEQDEVMTECKSMIKDELLPRQLQHISQIEELIEAN
jgi:uncharacterized protein (TIGR02284 family)